MRIGIVGPSKFYEENNQEIISQIAKIVAKSGKEIVVTPDKGSTSEFFAQEYIEFAGEKVWEIIPKDDKEWGFDYVNVDLGEIINCEVNESIIKNAGIGQNAKLDEECTVIEDRQLSIPPPAEGLQIGEIRDYRWLKDMRENDPVPGFANEFKINYD